MDLADSFIAVRIAMSVLLALAGIACIVFDRFLRDRLGPARAADTIGWTLEQTKISAPGASVGSVLMPAAVGRGYFSNHSIPEFELAVRSPLRRLAPGMLFQSCMPKRRR
jgi:hypothetical protein